jgi:4-hydroxy-tetrahydrodipicolinate synthase
MWQGMIPALITPFLEGGEKIDERSFEALLLSVLDGGAAGVVVGGTTGESPTLTEGELDLLTTMALRVLGKKIPVIVGTGTNATQKTVLLTKKARDLGAAAALVIVPYYNKPTSLGVIKHFEALREVKMPTILYHHPGRTGITLDLETLSTITQFDHVVGLKDCSKNFPLLRDLVERNPSLSIFSGDDETVLETLAIGGRGVISVIGNLIPREWSEVVKLALQGGRKEAKKLFLKLLSLMQAVNLEVNPQGIKCALALQGMCRNILRLPMVEANNTTRDAIQENLLATLNIASL